jgi:hypothetical protein
MTLITDTIKHIYFQLKITSNQSLSGPVASLTWQRPDLPSIVWLLDRHSLSHFLSRYAAHCHRLHAELPPIQHPGTTAVPIPESRNLKLSAQTHAGNRFCNIMCIELHNCSEMHHITLQTLYTECLHSKYQMSHDISFIKGRLTIGHTHSLSHFHSCKICLKQQTD